METSFLKEKVDSAIIDETLSKNNLLVMLREQQKKTLQGNTKFASLWGDIAVYAMKETWRPFWINEGPSKYFEDVNLLTFQWTPSSYCIHKRFGKSGFWFKYYYTLTCHVI